MLKAKNLYILKGTENFVRGELDNVALVDNAVCLEQMAGRYVLYGCYTSPMVNLPAFNQMVISWNADTPKGTVVEAQCRVLVGEEWCQWISFGKWSPYISRAAAERTEQGPVSLENGVVKVADARATRIQLRVYLYTEDERVTPRVRLLSACVQPLEGTGAEAVPYGRLLRLPAYSKQVRDPDLREEMDSPIALASLLNRWGQDILPEELTLAMYDHKAKSCANHSFATAVAGSYGYEAYLAYLDPARVWEHIKAGESVALELNYSATEEEKEKTGYPLLTGSFSGGKGQFMPMRGFALEQDGTVMALVNDCHAPDNRAAEKSYPAQEIWDAYTGLCLVVSAYHRSCKGGCPIRRYAALRPLTDVGHYVFQDSEGKDVLLDETFTGSLCAAVKDSTAWATTAHKPFTYLQKCEDGSIQLPQQLLQAGNKITVYAIWPSGSALVGQISL